MKNNRLMWAGAFILAFFCLVSPAQAAGTGEGTTISNMATIEWTVGAGTSDTTSLQIDTTVGSTAGDTLTDAADQTLAPGDTLIFTYEVYNTGNRSDTFNLWIDQFNLAGGASEWTFTLFVNGNQTSTLNDTQISISVAADAFFSCSVAISANSNPDSSPDGANAEFRLIAILGNAAGADTSGQYTGDNGTVYAEGSAGSNDTALSTISAASLTLAKVINSVTVGGVASVPIPGATIEYQLTYNNTGSGAADSVVLRDSIPVNTVLDTGSSQNTTLGASATLVDNDTGQTGWQFQLSTNASPDQTYNSADYTSIQFFSGAASNVRWVRWVRQTVASSETATLRFRTIIQ